ncbi:MAG: methyltransferase domain-containing protein [Dehalococcoidia bacterium]|nr:methyltransferase domain-containing protein [Dehalococcoidia bacterium]
MGYEPSAVAAHFDAFGEQEWARLDATLPRRIKYAVHRRFLDEYVQPGMRVADLGCGPGRFAIDAARAGARVTLLDLSQVQLDLARRKLDEARLLECIEGFEQGDICDLSRFEDASFDLVICYGGALSYARERHPEALDEIVRIAKPGAMLLLSVMSLYGTMRLIGALDARAFLEDFEQHMPWRESLGRGEVIYTQPGSGEFHQPMALFSSRGLAVALARAGAAPVTFAAANPLTPSLARIPEIESSEEATRRLLELEVAICADPSVVDNGEHLVAVARRAG